MFPFDNNTSENPSPESFLKTSSTHFLQNPNPPFFSTFPSPFFVEHELPLHQTLVAPDPIPETSPKSGKRKRKAGKKDRHSKICTAHGIRDRRMRLSLQVARKFFDIQDMLGYDKASATIEWLLSNSKPAIRQLLEEKRKNSNVHFAFESDSFSFSFSSECEVVSGVAHEVTSSEKNEKKKKSQKFKTPRCRNNDSVRESREKARARARRRTREKMMMKRHENGSSFDWANSVATLQTDQFLDDQKLGFSIDQEMSLAHANTSSLLLSPDRDAGTIEKLLGNSSGSNHSPISDNMMGFIGDWEMLSNATNQLVVSSSMAIAGNSNDNSVNTTQNYPFFAQ